MKKINIKLFIAFFLIASLFSSVKAYAADYGIDLPEVYETDVKTQNRMNGAEDDDYNAVRIKTLDQSVTLGTIIGHLAPQVTSEYESLLESDDIPMSAKRGIYGMLEDGVNALYESQPSVNVYAHLSEEWIPGYEGTSVYASDYLSGYDELQQSGIDQIWAVARNISYVFFILVMIIVGFMIMFRSKLGGQTLVTLGNTLPNIILALIGITFSFAIAGILIDIGGWIMAVLFSIFKDLSGFDYGISTSSFSSILQVLSPQGLVESLEGLLNIDFGAYQTSFFGLFTTVGGISLLGSIIPGIGGASFGTLLALVIILIVGIIGTFMVFITLTKAYLGILVNVITAPFQIAISAIPGKGVSFINWIKNVFRNVLVYPITFAILNLPGVLYGVSGGNLNLPGPSKLTLGDTSAGIENLFDGTLGKLFLVYFLQILVLFIASKADAYAQVIIPPTSTKEAMNAAQKSMEGISKIPLIGKLLVKK